jgi:3-oxoacyl-[acyl-carrier protein] reductase
MRRSKAGLIGLTRSLAREVASRGITVNAVAPGYIETPMTAVLDEKQRSAMMATDSAGTRRARTLEIAQSVAFLASEACGVYYGACAGCEWRHVHGRLKAAFDCGGDLSRRST